ncbi:MAG: hypothetical protein E7299_05525 [Lachnospiraceae bacterium]|nr:hypothetical protein [Lachnospiraceae bacterium]
MEKIKRIVGAVLFIGIAISALLGATYLFRGHVFGYNDRISVVGIKEEKKDSLDVIYIGGSAAFVYWEPMKAYKDCGFTSYDLATNSIQAESILAYIKYAQEYQNPDLYVIGVRAFQYYSEEGSESGLRLTSDSLDMGINKFNLIHEYLQNHTTEIDELSLYLDLVKYHTNYDALSNETAWHLIDNKEECDYKGNLIQSAWCYLEEPQDFRNDNRATLLENDEKVLNELLDYLDDNNINALFVVCPYSITNEDYSKYNTIGDMVTSHGYNFLNANDYYYEMGVDFSTDFYNVAHMNGVGAEKYTDFLERYISDNYDLPDHRGDMEYADWDEKATQFVDQSEACKEHVYKLISAADEGVNLGESIRATDDFFAWSSYVKDYRYSLFIVGNGEALVTDSAIDKKYLEYLGIDLYELFGTNSYIKFISDEMHTSNITIPDVVDNSLTVQAGQIMGKSSVTIDDKDNACSIIVEGTEYSRKDSDGINIVVFDNYYRTVIDSVTLKKIGENISIVR